MVGRTNSLTSVHILVHQRAEVDGRSIAAKSLDQLATCDAWGNVLHGAVCVIVHRFNNFKRELRTQDTISTDS